MPAPAPARARPGGGFARLSAGLVAGLGIFLVLNLAAWGVLAAIDAWQDRTNPVSRKYGFDLRPYYPGLDREEINQLLRVTWSLTPRHSPFVGRRLAPVESRFVNVSPHGFRRSADQAPWPPDRRRRQVVFLLGGSTAFGFGVQDEETIASHLQALLERSRSSDTRPPAVYNFGLPAAQSTMERILFQQLAAAGHVPDVVIFLDGLNDRWPSHEPLGTTEIRALHDEGKFTTLGSLAVELVRLLPLTRAVSRIAWATGLRRAGEVAPDVHAEGYVEMVVERYLTNVRMSRAVARELGVRPLFVWQPVPDYAYDPALHRFGPLDTPELRARRAVYEEMSRRWRSGALADDFAWCAEVGRDATEPLYVDIVHYTGAMSRRVADCIAEALGTGGGR